MTGRDEVSFALKMLILALVEGGHASMNGVVEYQGKDYEITIKEVKATDEGEIIVPGSTGGD